MVQDLVHNLCESLVENIDGVTGVGKKTPPTPITYLTQWKIVGNSEVHGVGNLTSWKVFGNSIVQDGVIMSCGDLGPDGKYHVKISNGVDIYDIALTEPLRKVNDVADTIEFPSETEGKALVTRNIISHFIGDCTIVAAATNIANVYRWSIATDAKIIPSSTLLVHNVLSSKYDAVTANGTYIRRQGVGIDSNGRVFIYDGEYTGSDDKENFKAANADVEVIYEAENPTTELVDVSPIAVSPTDTYTSANVTPYSAFEHTKHSEIWSCGEYNPTDGKYHILVQPQGGSIADIALDAPLRKVNDIADTIEFPATLEAFCNTDGSQILTTLPDDTILHIKQFVKNGDFSEGSTDWTIVNSNNISCDFTQGKAIIQNKVQGRGFRYGICQDIKSNIVIGNAYYWKYDAVPCKNIQLGADYSNCSKVKVSCIGNTNNIVSNIDVPISINSFYLGFPNTTDYEIGDTTEVDNVVSFNLDVMFADCPSLKPTTASEFEALFTNINYIAYSNTAIDVIVKGGKLYKYVETEGKALVTRNLTSVDMGDLTWEMAEISSSGYFRFRTSSIRSSIQGAPNNDTAGNILCALYETKATNRAYYKDTCIGEDVNGQIIGYDPNYNQSDSAAAFKTAMDGVELIYELATPTTELVDAPQIEEAESYSMVISQGGKAVEWTEFVANPT